MLGVMDGIHQRYFVCFFWSFMGREELGGIFCHDFAGKERTMFSLFGVYTFYTYGNCMEWALGGM